MTFPYKTVLIFGASSGIGEALAERCFDASDNVIVTARREENLKKLCSGHPNVHYRVHDMSDLKSIESFAKEIVSAFPELDCIIINAGIQRGFDFSKPDTIDLATAELEFDTNYISYLYILKYFLPHLLSKAKTAVVCTSSGLSLVPLPRCPNYCATKAALHQFLLSLRYQLRNTSVKVIEIFPPAVQTELHDEKHQPDIKNGRSIGISLKEFTDGAWTGLLRGDEEIPVGPAVHWYEAIERPRQKVIAQMRR